MRNYKDVGILIELKQLKEATKLAVIWTRSDGKKGFIVKGANKILSRKLAALDTGNLFSFGAYASKGDLDLLLEANLIDDFQDLKKSLENMGLLYYFLEVAQNFLADEQANTAFFEKFLSFLTQICEHPGDNYKYLVAFQMEVLKEFGYAPLLDSCSECLREFKLDEVRIANNSNEPGLICYRHFLLEFTTQSLISDRMLKILRFLKSASLNEIDRLDITIYESEILFNIQNNWICTIIEKEIRSAKLLKLWKKPIV